MEDPTKQPKLVISRSIIAKKEIKQSSGTGQNFIGVWLDENSERTDDKIYIDLKRDLESSFDCLQTYKKAMDCIKYLGSSESSKILFIISHKHAFNIMAIIEEEVLSQIHSMYIFCLNESEKDSWKSKIIEKIRGSYVCKDELMQQLKDDINVININNETPQKSTISLSTQDNIDERSTNAVPPISVFSTKPINNSIKHLNKDSVWFVRYQLLFEIILKLEKSTTAAAEMIHVCKELCKDDAARLKQIEEFTKDAENAFESLYWYTKDSFIVHLLNKACGSQNVDEVYPFRLYISNLHNELVKLDTDRRKKNQENKTTVFRGKYLALSTFEKLKSNKNGLVAMNGFLSTTRNENAAKFFVNEGAPKPNYCVGTFYIGDIILLIQTLRTYVPIQYMAVLFKLNIDSKVVNKPYADIPPERHEKGSSEEELLFSIGSVWRIIDVKELKDDTNPVAEMWCVELMLSNEDDEQSKALAEYLRKEIGETTTIWTLGDFLIKVGQYKQAEDYYRLLEHILPESDINQATIYNRIAYARYEREDYNAALDCIKIAMQYAPKNSEVAIVTEYNQQMIVAEASLAILCAPALRRQFEDYNINGKYLVSNSASISIISNNLGRIYHKLGHFHHALRYYDDALKILLKSELSFLPEISAIYNNIGGVQYSKGNYNDAAENFLLAMTTLSKLDSNHPWIREYTDNYQAAHCRMDSNKPKRLKAE